MNKPQLQKGDSIIISVIIATIYSAENQKQKTPHIFASFDKDWLTAQISYGSYF